VADRGEAHQPDYLFRLDDYRTAIGHSGHEVYLPQHYLVLFEVLGLFGRGFGGQVGLHVAGWFSEHDYAVQVGRDIPCCLGIRQLAFLDLPEECCVSTVVLPVISNIVNGLITL
jgi:hypothetical protein